MPLDLSTLPTAAIRAFCERNRIRRLAIFGSALRDDFTPESDIDVLVEFEPQLRIGLVGFQKLEDELTRIVGRRVDLNTPGFLHSAFRDEAVEESRSLYVAA